MRVTAVAWRMLTAICLVMAVGVTSVAVQAGPVRDADGRNLAPLDVGYQFDADGLLSLGDASRLPVVKGSLVAHWFAYRGWAVVVFEGLDLARSGPVCLGTSAIDPATGLVTSVSFDASAAGACDDAGAGAVPRAPRDRGVRVCANVVAYITRIPAESSGPLVADLIVFLGDGTGLGLSGRLERPQPLAELDSSIVDCGLLPPVRVPVPATPTPLPVPELTPAPAGRGSVAARDRASPPPRRPIDACPTVDADGLVDVYRSPASPYLLHEPAVHDEDTATIIFLPGGTGGHAAAQRVWETFLSNGQGFDSYRVVIPYAVDEDLIDDAARTFAILDEVLWCFGGDPWRVHLGGTSNGGLAAYGLMVSQPERFATLLGAPGAFPVQDPSSVDPAIWLDLLGGRAVLNGVGEYDEAWRAEVVATHNALVAAGVESGFVEFPDQGHIAGPDFDSSPLLEFWREH